jgi:oligoendopeptidase F
MATSASLPIRAEVPVEQTWDLASVYPSDAAWEAAVRAAEGELEAPTRYRGHLGESAAVLLEALQTRDRLRGDVWRISLYASMQSAVDSADQAAQGRSQRAGALFARLGAATAYIEPELLDLAPGHLGRFLADSDELAVYEHYFDRLERRRPHVRSADVEEVLADSGPLAEAHQHTYGVLTNAEIDMGTIPGEDGGEVRLIQGNVDDLKRSTDPAVRRAAWERYADSYLKVKNTLAGTVTGAVRRDVFYARARRYPSAVAAALEQSHLPRQVYDNLIGSIRRHYPLWHRFWGIKRRAIGVEKLHTYDTFAPLTRGERVIPFAQAREIILTGLAPMGEEYLATLRRGLTGERWVDWAVNQNKSSGAFSTGAPGTHPFILQSYCDGLLNVSTLAHELGHSMHSHYTWATQPVVYSEYGMFVAETASNFHQALLRAHFLKTETDPDFLLEVLNETMNNFHRYFFIMPILSQFEVAVHAAVERGEGLTAEGMSATLVGLFREGYGPEVVVDEARVGITWAQFGHLFANFYVHQYALGIAAANALADGVMREGRPAAERYIAFLKAGDSVYPLDALRIAGVDLTSPEPIERAFGALEDAVNRLDTLVGAGPLRG